MPIIKLDYTNTKIRDTYVDSANPTANYSTGTGLNFGDDMFSLIKFDMGLIPNNAIINSAKLTLCSTANTGAGLAELHEITSDWDETTVTWNTKPSYDSNIFTTINRTSATSTPYETNVTPLVQKQVNGNSFGILIKASTVPTSINFYSSEGSGAQRPTLTIDYTIPTTDKKQVEYIDGVGYNNAAQVTSHTIPVPTNKQAGDMLVAYITLNTVAGTYTLPNGWTALSEETWAASSGRKTIVLYKKSDGTETSFTIKASTAIYANCFVGAYRNVKAITTPSIMLERASTQHYPNAITSMSEKQMLVLMISAYSSVTATPPLNFTERYDANLGGASVSLSIHETYNHDKPAYTTSEMTVAISTSQTGIGKAIIFEPVTNLAPHIDGQDEHLGSFETPLTKQYTVSDTEGNAVTITEKLNGNVVNTRSSAGTFTLDLTSQWDALPLGKHTVTIEANDDYNNPPHEPRIRTWTFNKLLEVNPKVPKVISGVSDMLAKFEGLKEQLIDKVGGNPTDKFEDIIKNGDYGTKHTRLLINTAPSTKSFTTSANASQTAYYVPVDLSLIDFIPSRIVVRRQDTGGLTTTTWFYESFYSTDVNTSLSTNYNLKIPYVNGVMDIAVGAGANVPHIVDIYE